MLRREQGALPCQDGTCLARDTIFGFHLEPASSKPIFNLETFSRAPSMLEPRELFQVILPL